VAVLSLKRRNQKVIPGENTTANYWKLSPYSVPEAGTAHTQPEDYTPPIMASRNIEAPSISEICARVKHLGYAVSKRVRLYGEEFDVVSDPFPDADGIAVHVTTKKDSKIRVLQIPATVLQSIRERARSAA
jgi:hypothetical protein